MAKTPLFTVFRAFHVFLKLQKPCEYHHFLRSTRQKCCNLQCFFCLAFKNTGLCSVLCISGPKSIGIYSIFCVFAWLPPTTLKRKNAVIYSILWLSKSEKSSEKCVRTALFSDFRYPQKRGGAGLCSWRRLWATRIPAKKLSPTLLKDFWCFSGPGVGGSAAWGAPHHRALSLYAFVSILVWSRRSRILRADAPRRLRRISRPSISSQCGLESFWMGTCFRFFFFLKVHGIGTLLEIDGFFGEQVSSRKLLPRVFPEELLPISSCYFV